MDLQVKLLTVLQDRELVRLGWTKPIAVNVRVAAGTNRDLTRDGGRTEVSQRLLLLPERGSHPDSEERREDINPLGMQFRRMNATGSTASERSWRRGLWAASTNPRAGNVRELRNVVARLLVTSPGDLIGPGTRGRAPHGEPPVSDHADGGG